MKLKLFNILLIALAISGCRHKRVNSSSQPIYGIDVSHHQGNIKWSSVKKWNKHAIQFVYIKATEGATYQDPKYHYNISQASKHGLKVGSYHYFRTTSPVERQLANFLKM